MEASPSDFAHVVDRFLAQYTSATADIYRSTLRQWVDFTSSRNRSPLEGVSDDLTDWIETLRKDGLRANSVATKVTCIRGLYRTAVEVGAIPSDPMAHVQRPHVEYSVKTDSLTLDELVRLLEAAESEGPTSHALACLLGLCGLRSGECIGLNVDDLEIDADGQGRIHVAGRRGSKGASVPIGRRTATACRGAVADRTSGPLIPGHDGGRLHAAAMRRTLRRLAKQADISGDHVTTQSLRMTFYEAAKQAGVPDKDIAASMGFRSRAMLEYYDN